MGNPHPLDAHRIGRTQAALRHRGPDDRGLLLWDPVAARTSTNPERAASSLVGLLHQRLAIIDLSHAAAQPMQDASGKLHIVFNGEIYNYLELRDELVARGHRFRTRSDTEVLLAGYAEWGEAVLPRLTGMFAFAILDSTLQQLFLARDPFGIKPLYYTSSKGVFYFASELPALLELASLPAQLNAQCAYEYLAGARLDHTDATFFADTRSLPAAHWLRIDLHQPVRVAPVRYWRAVTDRRRGVGLKETAAEVRALFLDSVRLHMRSDVPIGACLSGGIDSSAIVCAVRHLYPKSELHTFSYIAKGSAMSEERWIDQVAVAVGAASHKVVLEPEHLLQDLDALIRAQAEPFASTSIYAQYSVFQRAQAEGVKVMLDGQGADELLAGYPVFQGARLAELLRTGRGLAALEFLLRSSRWPGRSTWQILQHAGQFLVPAGLYSLARRAVGRDIWPAWLDRDWFRARGVAGIAKLGSLERSACLHEVLRQTLEVTSVPGLLRYEDRNSMVHSIESRVPFLTPQLANYLYSLPAHHLIDRDGQSKAVFREAMRGIVPDAVLDRRDKIGFATPERDWLHKLTPWVEQNLAKAVDVPFLRVPALQAEWHSVIEGREAFDFRVWRWLNLLRWLEVFQVRLV